MEVSRGSCWSLTINNPTPEDMNVKLPAGWKLQGQMELGKEGTEHFQAMLNTPQVRFSAVKRIFPRAHIEKAKNPAALKAYVHKDETRIAEVQARQTQNIFEAQDLIADAWDWEVFNLRIKDIEVTKGDEHDNAALRYVDHLVGIQIDNGAVGLEFTAVNPMWRSSWKSFWKNILRRRQTDRQTDTAVEPPIPPSPAELISVE